MANKAATRGSNALKLVDQRRGTHDDGPLYADAGDVEEFAQGLKETFLYCRELGHNWRAHTARRLRKQDGGGFIRTLRCVRCKGEREQELTSSGLVVSDKRTYPDGYLSKGMGRIVGDGRGVLRLESLKRLTGKTA